jgi:hypothetical protein
MRACMRVADSYCTVNYVLACVWHVCTFDMLENVTIAERQSRQICLMGGL